MITLITRTLCERAIFVLCMELVSCFPFYSSDMDVWMSVCVCYNLIFCALLLLSIAVVIGHSWVELCGRGIT